MPSACTAAPIQLRIAGSAAARRKKEGEVLRVAQEALTHALRHAEAERIELFQ